MTAPSRAIARRYARALLDVAQTQPGSAEPLRAELAAFVRLVQTSRPLRQALLHPTLRAAARLRVLADVAASAGASALLRRLLELLSKHDRLDTLPALAEEYARELNLRQGRVEAEAVTAVPLEPAQQEALASALRHTVGRTVELSARVDPAVLGGVLVRVAGRTYDGTVRGRLAAMRARLASGR